MEFNVFVFLSQVDDKPDDGVMEKSSYFYGKNQPRILIVILILIMIFEWDGIMENSSVIFICDN